MGLEYFSRARPWLWHFRHCWLRLESCNAISYAHCMPGVSPTAQLYSTVLLGQTGPAADSDHEALRETVAWQKGGGSWQEDIGKAARLEHKDADQHQEPA